MLFNEPKLLKYFFAAPPPIRFWCFSALQRAEIAEIVTPRPSRGALTGFSALQRAEIAEMVYGLTVKPILGYVSVLFNEPKLLKL